MLTDLVCISSMVVGQRASQSFNSGRSYYMSNFVFAIILISCRTFCVKRILLNVALRPNMSMLYPRSCFESSCAK